MDELVVDFKAESLTLIGEMLTILEAIEGDASKFTQLEQYGQIVDRIMGASKSLALMDPKLKPMMEPIGKYTEVCKEVAYKGSQVPNNEALFNAVVGLLFDGAEMIKELVEGIGNNKSVAIKDAVNQTFLERLVWVTKQFGSNLRGTLDTGANKKTSEIEELLKKMGL